MATYYLAKLNINGKILAGDEEFQHIKNTLIPNFLIGIEQFNDSMKTYYSKRTNDSTAPVKSIGWKFTDVKRIDDNIITGNLIKNVTKQQLVFSDDHAKSTKVEYKEDLTGVKFFYSIKQEIFAYQSSTSIPYQETPQKIEQIFKVNDDGSHIGEIRVILKTERSEISNKLTSGVIKKFEMDFIIPNDKKTTDSIADVLLNNGIKKAEMKGENADGIDSVDDSGKLKGLIKEVVELMNQGYANATFWMSKDKKTKKTKKVTSKTMAQKRNIDENDIEDIRLKVESSGDDD